MSFQIKPVTKKDKTWVTGLLKEWWAGPEIVTRRKIHQVDEYPGFLAVLEGNPVGLVTYHIDRQVCEITSMNSLAEGKGIGTALVDAVINMAKTAWCKRLWLITTNDNTAALRFWQKRGFFIVAVYPDALKETRRLKPEIPLTGNDGIEIRDEIELEMML